MTRPKVTTEAEWKREIKRDMAIQSRRGRTRQVALRGTTAERDARFPTPTTVEERVALANARIAWFNTDFGWWESYFNTADTGMVVPTLRTGVTPGWYPTGTGPYSKLSAPSAAQSVTTDTYVTWAAYGTNESRRRGGAAWFTYASALVDIKQHGMYDIDVFTTQQAGSGFPVVHITRNANSIRQTVTELNSLYVTPVAASRKNIYLAPGDDIGFLASIGSYQINVGSGGPDSRGEFVIRYVGPALNSE